MPADTTPNANPVPQITPNPALPPAPGSPNPDPAPASHTPDIWGRFGTLITLGIAIAGAITYVNTQFVSKSEVGRMICAAELATEEVALIQQRDAIDIAVLPTLEEQPTERIFDKSTEQEEGPPPLTEGAVDKINLPINYRKALEHLHAKVILQRRRAHAIESSDCDTYFKEKSELLAPFLSYTQNQGLSQ